MRSHGSLTVATLPLFLSLAGCGDSDRLELPTFVSINVTGLSGTVELVLNGGESRRISSDGFFSFGTHRAASEVHAVTIRSQPAGQTCSVRNGPGPARSSSISIVVVTCVTNTYAIGGTVSGLDGSVELQNGSDVIAVSSNGSFTFPARHPAEAAYAVTVRTQPAGATCEIVNGEGVVGAQAVTNIAVNCVFNSFSVGGTVSGLVSGYASDVVLQLNGGDTLAVSNAGAFVFPAMLAVGAGYSVTVAASPSVPVQNCTVNNGSGTIAAADITNVAVTCAAPISRYAYLTDQNGNLGICAIDAATGAISHVGSQSVSSHSIYGLTLAAGNRFLYVANMQGNAIAAFSVDAGTGSLTPIASSPFATGAMGPRTISATPDGRFLHVEGQSSSSVSTFAIDAVTGALSVSGAPVASGSQPTSIATTPNGKFTYTANASSLDVSAYSIDASSGALSAVGTYALSLGSAAFSVGIEPRGKFLYVSNYDNAIFGFEIDDDAGTLTPVSGSPFLTGALPKFAAAEPGARFIYVGNATSQDIAAFSIDPTSGALSAIGGSPFANGTAADNITVAPDGKFVYVSSEAAGIVSVYSRDQATGVLTPISGSPFSTGSLRPTNLVILAQ